MIRLLKILLFLVVLAGVGLVIVATAPSLHGQRDDRIERRPRALSLLAGRGAAIGVSVRDVIPAEAGGQPQAGALIDEVRPDSPADKAGIKRGDIIVEFDGERVRSGRQFVRLLQETPAGQTVKATITRNGQRQDVQLKPSEERASTFLSNGDRFFYDADQWRDKFGDLDRLWDLPSNFSFALPEFSAGGRLGVTVDELTHQLAEHFGAKEGVLVASVADGSAASRAGIKAGDVITSINGERVASPADLTRALRRAENDEVTVGIVRDKKEMSVKAKIEAPRRTIRGARPV